MIVSIETALVADDDVLMREFVVETLTRNGIQVAQVGNGLDARHMLEEKAFDLAFIDLKMPGLDGMQVLKFMRTGNLDTLPIIITAFGTVEKAVEAMKMGAYDFLMKPFSPEQVEIIIKRAKEWVELQAQNAYLQEELGWKLPRGRQMIGQSAIMTSLMDSIMKVAKSASSVLITGESGTGKELVALALHALSERKDQPFIRMNCAAVPDTLMDSELFGHEKGAFTSAVSMRLGRFELARRGTLLLDEISEMPIGVQAKLLRVLQEREFERVGGSRTIKIECRIITTTNRDLKKHVEEGKFRQDLFYRLNVVPIPIPPLRDRREDLPLLVANFITRFSGHGEAPENTLRFTKEAMGALQNYSWPGNVRELENLVERLCVLEEGQEIGIDRLPQEIGHAQPRQIDDAKNTLPCPQTEPVFSLPEIERRAILSALDATDGNRTKAAKLLNISIRTLRNKLNEYRQNNLLPDKYL